MNPDPFPVTFGPAQLAVNLLSAIAKEPENPHHQAACCALDAWRSSLATPEQIAMVETSDDLEIDDAGACVSESDRGFFIQTWTWVECVTGPTDSDGSPCRFLNRYRCDDCDIGWADQWSCECNDRCPTCDAEIEPEETIEVDADGNAA